MKVEAALMSDSSCVAMDEGYFVRVAIAPDSGPVSIELLCTLDGVVALGEALLSQAAYISLARRQS